MSEEQEKHLEKLIPMQSCLGREFLALQSERNKQRRIFESSPSKMSADTLAYRRSEIALGRFLDDIIDLVSKKAPSNILQTAEHNAKHPMWGSPLKIDRRSERIIWTRHAIERYRFALPKKDWKFARACHPGLWHDLRQAWRDFRKEIKTWQYGGQAFDGSQAMHLMIAFQVKARLLASAND